MRELVFRKHAVLLYAVVTLVGTVGAARADTFFTIHNTGAPGGNYGTDPNWLYYSTTTDPSINPGVLPSGSSAPYLVDYSAWPLGSGPWNQNTGSGSTRGNWIGPTPTYMSFGGKWYLTAAPSTYFVYQTSFYIPTNVDLTKVLITGLLSSDNCNTSVGINGVGLGGSIISTPNCLALGDSYTNAHAFEIGGVNANFGPGTGVYTAYALSLQAGWNTIQFTVYNDATTSSPNPTGLVVWDLQGRAPSIPEPATAGLVIAALAGVFWLRRRSSLPPA